MSSLIVEVCKVDNIIKHPNADRLSIATVKGWNCIVGLDQYKVGDLVIFVPPDCIIPTNLIEKHNLEYLKNNGKTSSVKLRGYLSQGLILDLTDLPKGNYKAGNDVASALGITKWEPPQPKYSVRGAKQTSKKKINPNFDKYTDIENIRNYNDVFKAGDIVVITEKIHGANSRFGNLKIDINKNLPFFELVSNLFQKYILGHKYQFVYGSHNVQITNHSNRNSYYGEDVWGSIAQRYNLAKIIPQDYIVYAEIYGEGIQDLTYGLKGVDLVVFDIKYKGQYLNWHEVRNLCYVLNLPVVPELYSGIFSEGLLNEYTNGKSLLFPSQIREGCVIKMFDESNDPRIGRKILKSVSTEYLTRKNGTEFQ
jgi:RNA ligase (TIGR02306 family)